LGATAENQKWVDKRLPHLSESSARIRFLSCEPLLGKINLESWLADGTIDWVIAGGESGPGARPSDPEWFLDLRNQCLRNAVPFHFKQWGDWAPVDTVQCELIPSAVIDSVFSRPLARFGKKRSGRLLDGRTWDGLPITA
jgi:protein gp37